MLHTNADQVTSEKFNELMCKIKLHKALIVAICEVKPKTKSNPVENKIHGYTLRHANLNKNGGRGIAVYTKIELDSSISQIESKFQEIVRLDIKLKVATVSRFPAYTIALLNS